MDLFERLLLWMSAVSVVLAELTPGSLWTDPSLPPPSTMGLLDAVIHHAKVKQTASVIFLHGLGDSGHGWSDIAPMLANALPHVKFVFPHAPPQPVTLNGGYRMPSWYDIYSLEDRDGKVDEVGLLASAGKVNDLIKNEIETHGIASNRIVVGGFSQGAAMSLLTLVHSQHKLAGVVAMSGYFPMSTQFDSIVSAANRETPVWMGHGTSDPVVRFSWGEKSRDFLREKGYTVDFNKYVGLQHSANDEELMDLAMFLRNTLPESTTAPAE
ncbi:Phospholipase/carboxylesterase/thioesterase [Blastocladiella britannica]|nr:Phospholipase/carboxylesterase/thioesterase [Blastocladiella britannica]